MNPIYDYAIISIWHQKHDQIDIRVSRDIPMKEIKKNLFVALSWDRTNLNGYYAKSDRTNLLIDPSDTLII